MKAMPDLTLTTAHVVCEDCGCLRDQLFEPCPDCGGLTSRALATRERALQAQDEIHTAIRGYHG